MGGGDGKKAKPIVHSMEALSFFDKYKFPTPADSAAVPATLEAVEAKVKEFKAKQEKKIEEDKKKARRRRLARRRRRRRPRRLRRALRLELFPQDKSRTR